MSIDYPPPLMSDGSTYADRPWWQGKADHGATTEPTTFAEAEALTWARCWAYGEAMGMTTHEWHLMWPIVYATLNACATAWPGAGMLGVLASGEVAG